MNEVSVICCTPFKGSEKSPNKNNIKKSWTSQRKCLEQILIK